MPPFDTWESYLYPPPDDATMRNLADIRDPEALRTFEYRMAAIRRSQLRTQPDLIAHTYDTAHLRAIHRHLFQDVYEWAGDYRSVNIFKPGQVRGFADVTTDEIDRYLADAHTLIMTTPWAALERKAFAESAATVFAHLNQAHPFREGNGRASKMFMLHVAELSSYTFDFTRISPDAWNQASALSGPDLYSYEVVPDFLIPVFEEITIPREES